MIVGALLGSAIVCLALDLIFSPKVSGRRDPTQLIISEDNRYSNSQISDGGVVFRPDYDLYCGSAVFESGAVGWDFAGGMNIPKNLLCFLV